MTKDQRTGTRAGVQLQHRHYAFIAATIAAIECPDAKRKAAQAFSKACAATNPRFNSSRFWIACCEKGAV
jgi:hypothetical protein